MYTAQDTIFPYLLKEYLIYFIGFLTVTVLALFLTLIVHKLHTEKKERKKRRFTAEYKSAVSQHVNFYAPLAVSPENDLQFKAFADVCVDMLAGASPSEAEKIKSLLKELQVVDHFKRVAASASWTKRFYAVEILGFFMIDDLKGFFREVLIRDSSREVRSRALWALSLIADKEDIELITRLLATDISNSSKFNVYIYSNVISSCRKRGIQDSVTDFIKGMKEDQAMPIILKRDLIEACGVSGLKEAAGLIIGYFSSHQHDSLMKIACLRGLGALGSLNAGIIMNNLTDKDWRVRAVAAKASHTPEDTVISELQKLLYDPVYIVRINSARALSRSGTKGSLILERERNSEDRFVRDTARFILEEAEGRCLKV
ncbi:MAG: HEAT repeat domain-containing protein [Nitrospiraceae bacterium]|nr:MAG: HEAT repeat domain-containing protein [Nitrospiraceae bacterium]